jgi:hypothetical protein
MVDDHLMEITHVLRGAEWLSTFPLHVNVVRAFGWDEPEWVHLSLFLKPSGKGKISATPRQRSGWILGLHQGHGGFGVCAGGCAQLDRPDGQRAGRRHLTLNEMISDS